MNMRRWIAAALLGLAAAAGARAPDGRLDILLTPHNGVPALVTPGGAFDALLTRQAGLRLQGAGGAVMPLTVEWLPSAGALAVARCTVPPDTPPGTYALEATAEDRSDRTGRAVFVLEAFASHYLAAHVTDIHIGASGRARPPADVFRGVLQAINESLAAFVLITGDLTEGGEPQQFQEFLTLLDTCERPTFVCAGNHDRQGLNCEEFLAVDNYLFWYGTDAYLVFDTKDLVTADDLGPQPTQLELYRRAMKPARWAVGATHRYEPSMGMRSQITLFIDNPLDHLFFGHWHRPNDTSFEGVPWGATPVTVTPAAADGFLRLFELSGRGVRPHEPERVTPAE